MQCFYPVAVQMHRQTETDHLYCPAAYEQHFSSKYAEFK